MIKTDPRQTKMVVVLLVVLAGAIAFTVVRMLPSSRPAPAGSQDETTPPARPAAPGPFKPMPLGPARDPFLKPSIMRDAATVSPGAQPEAGLRAAGDVSCSPWRESASSTVKPLELVPDLAVAPPTPKDDPRQKADHDKPEFVLLATIHGCGGWSAIVQAKGAEPQVVEVGDVVGEGFKVRKLEWGRAVLTNGKETAIAKRPQM